MFVNLDKVAFAKKEESIQKKNVKRQNGWKYIESNMLAS